MSVNPKDVYAGNINLRKAGSRIGLTREQIVEYRKCMLDPVYFASRYMYITNIDEGRMLFEMYDFQKDLINLMKDNRFVIAKLSRQVGKCVLKDTKIKLKHPILTKNGEIEIEIGVFHDWVKFCSKMEAIFGQY